MGEMGYTRPYEHREDDNDKDNDRDDEMTPMEMNELIRENGGYVYGDD